MEKKMKKYIYSAFIVACAALASNAQAQNKLFLNKGNDKVETVELGEGDYIAFGRPEGVPTQRLAEIINEATTKNSIKYSILTKDDQQPCYQVVVSEYFLDAYMQQFMQKTLATASEEDIIQAISQLMYARYGYGFFGSTDFNLINGEEDKNGETLWIKGGTNYYIATCDLVLQNNNYVLGNDFSYKVVKTNAPVESREKIDVKFMGLDANGLTKFSVDASSGIKTLHMILATTKSVDEGLNVYGYDFLMDISANNFTREQWNELNDEDKVWNVTKEDDYSFLVLGIDENGDQVKVQLDNIHIKPIADDNCPNLDTESFESNNGEIKATYKFSSKTNSSITKATVLLIPENTWDNLLNDLVRKNGYEKPSEGWPIVAAGDGSVDVTDQLNADGTYTYTKSIPLVDRDWYVLVFAVTDENGTTITRTSFHSHLENAESETISHTYPTTATAKSMKAGLSKKQMKAATSKVIKLK